LLTIHLGNDVIPAFKREKLSIYSKVLQGFAIMEINNAHQAATFWSQVVKTPNLQNIKA